MKFLPADVRVIDVRAEAVRCGGAFKQILDKAPEGVIVLYTRFEKWFALETGLPTSPRPAAAPTGR